MGSRVSIRGFVRLFIDLSIYSFIGLFIYFFQPYKQTSCLFRFVKHIVISLYGTFLYGTFLYGTSWMFWFKRLKVRPLFRHDSKLLNVLNLYALPQSSIYSLFFFSSFMQRGHIIGPNLALFSFLSVQNDVRVG